MARLSMDTYVEFAVNVFRSKLSEIIQRQQEPATSFEDLRNLLNELVSLCAYFQETIEFVETMFIARQIEETD